MNQILSKNLSNTNIINNKFSDFGLNTKLLENISYLGYTTPTAIQNKSIPAILNGYDVIASSQTGTGKTAAFLIPIIQKIIHLSNPSMSPAKHQIKVLILTPTRELASQIHENIIKYCNNTMLRSCVIFGGVNFEEQNKILHSGCEILVATPGRLIDHIKSSNINFNYLSFFVLDEADKMLDMGFSYYVEQIIQALPVNKQTILFSATFNKEINKLSQAYLKNPIEIKLNDFNTIADTIKQTIYIAESKDLRKNTILYLLKNHTWRKVILFANKKSDVYELNKFLSDANISSDFLHSGKSQKDRNTTINAFKNDQFNVLVATDVASRGLDILVSCVINYDITSTLEDYIHRIGRTGRAGIKGESISFCFQKDEKIINNIKLISKENVNIKYLSNKKDLLNLDLINKYSIQNSEKCVLLNDNNKIINQILDSNYSNIQNKKQNNFSNQKAILLGGKSL
ncbi:ATP-dependent RNA helicase RhlE [Candidatus Kinetoplastibacterium sorsogonicusi]|uniref:ATP-dependent RNA helicase RhlE n=1 Tax=Candidatus Kinetoplastidibacterium kentomonadis TaxID=1576550 RepID=A0A3Q8EUE7_9PROT|nr:DEAD/DEAH box helicase [Candidatus Kinetoplastibacterium sorsogonicusi]AWD32623.1 ATP-dependent RNA helicase RhlE [Candidatus Kinetoplastibacterium sorsogonicusi]